MTICTDKEWEEDTTTLLPCFDELVAQYDFKVRSAIRSVQGFTSDEDDLVQEVFVRFLVRLRRPGSLRVGAWLWRVARNLAIDDARRRQARTRAGVELGLSQPVSFETRHDEGLNECLSDIFREMPERQRHALLEMADHGARSSGSCQAVAASLGVSTSVAEGLLARGRSRLASGLSRSGFAFKDGALLGSFGITLARWVRWVPRVGRRHAMALAGVASAAAAIPLATTAIFIGGELRPVPIVRYVGAVTPIRPLGYHRDRVGSEARPVETNRGQGSTAVSGGAPSPLSTAQVSAPAGATQSAVQTSMGLASSILTSTAGASGPVVGAVHATGLRLGTVAPSAGSPAGAVRGGVGVGGSASDEGPSDGAGQESQPLLIAVATAAPLSLTPSR